MSFRVSSNPKSGVLGFREILHVQQGQQGLIKATFNSCGSCTGLLGVTDVVLAAGTFPILNFLLCKTLSIWTRGIISDLTDMSNVSPPPWW